MIDQTSAQKKKSDAVMELNPFGHYLGSAIIPQIITGLQDHD